MSIDASAEMAAISIKSLAEARLDGDADPQVRAASDAAANSCQALLAISDLAREKLATISDQEKRGLLPKAGADSLRSEVTAEAEALANTASQEYKAAATDAMDLAVTEAIPTVPLEREVLARQEFSLALGSAEGVEATARAHGLLQGGSDEAKAILFTSFGRQALISKGVSNVDQFLADSQRQLASEDEISSVALAKLDKLDTAFEAGSKALVYSLGI